MTETNLIVRADGFGSSHAANQAILEAFESGLLTCASLAIPCPWVPEAVALCHEHPEWEVGLQLTLRCTASGSRWGPVAGAAAVPSLVDDRGMFLPTLPAAAAEADVVRECDAQVARARAFDMSPAFLECDEFAHPAVAGTLHRLSQQLGAPSQITAWGVRPLSLPSSAARPRDEAVAELLRSLGPGTYLWITRPAHDSPETWAMWSEETAAREAHADARALCSPALRSVVAERSIELLSVRQHVETCLGTEAEGE
jgi:predicted glycoside hydrolase/deacetylase ChbG (UPF0249 family)